MEVRVTQCRSCRAEIVWARTPRGKNMPIDATPVPDGEWMLVEGEDEKPQAKPFNSTHAAADGMGQMARYQSHFKSCPNADKHSKGRGGQPSHPQRGAPAGDATVAQLHEENAQLKERIAKCRNAYVAMRKERDHLAEKLRRGGE